jgi:hypothetical protein
VPPWEGSEEQEERTLPEIKRVERVDAARGCEGEGVSRFNKSLRALQPKNEESKKENLSNRTKNQRNKKGKNNTHGTEHYTSCHRYPHTLSPSMRRHQRERAREGIAKLPVFGGTVVFNFQLMRKMNKNRAEEEGTEQKHKCS